MDIVRQNKTKFKVPVFKDKIDDRIVAIGSNYRLPTYNMNDAYEEQTENIVFRTQLKYHARDHTGYTTDVWFITPEGIFLRMKNQGAINLLEFISDGIAHVTPNGFIEVLLTFGQRNKRFHVKPVRK
jgi:hypothetical protein